MISIFKRDDQSGTGSSGQGSGPRASEDDGLGVPPFRPASAPAAQTVKNSDQPITADKETTMARSPFAPPTATPSSGQSVPMPPGGPVGGLRTTGTRGADSPERRTLVVGRGISVQGVVQDAERLVVEGTVEATMIAATELAITQGGVFKGEVEVEEAEIAGTIDGTLVARHALVVRSTGRVLGTARCRRLQVEDGGQITGRIEMLADHPGQQSALPVSSPPANKD